MQTEAASGGGGAGGVVFTSFAVTTGAIYNGFNKIVFFALINCVFLRIYLFFKKKKRNNIYLNKMETVYHFF